MTNIIISLCVILVTSGPFTNVRTYFITHFANSTKTDNKVLRKTTRRNQYRPRESVVVTLEQNSVTTWTAGQTDVG